MYRILDIVLRREEIALSFFDFLTIAEGKSIVKAGMLMIDKEYFID